MYNRVAQSLAAAVLLALAAPAASLAADLDDLEEIGFDYPTPVVHERVVVHPRPVVRETFFVTPRPIVRETGIFERRPLIRRTVILDRRPIIEKGSWSIGNRLFGEWSSWIGVQSSTKR